MFIKIGKSISVIQQGLKVFKKKSKPFILYLFILAITKNGQNRFTQKHRNTLKRKLKMSDQSMQRGVEWLRKKNLLVVQKRIFNPRKKKTTYWECWVHNVFLNKEDEKDKFHIFELKPEYIKNKVNLKSLVVLSLIKDNEAHPKNLKVSRITQKMLAEFTHQSKSTIEKSWEQTHETLEKIEKFGSNLIELAVYRGSKEVVKSDSYKETIERTYITKSSFLSFAEWYETKKLKIHGQSCLGYRRDLYKKQIHEPYIEIQSLFKNRKPVFFTEKTFANYKKEKEREFKKIVATERRLVKLRDTKKFRDSLTDEQLKRYKILRNFYYRVRKNKYFSNSEERYWYFVKSASERIRKSVFRSDLFQSCKNYLEGQLPQKTQKQKWFEIYQREERLRREKKINEKNLREVGEKLGLNFEKKEVLSEEDKQIDFLKYKNAMLQNFKKSMGDNTL